MSATRADSVSLAELSDVELAERCRLLDEDAVRELTRRHNQRLYRIARSIVRDDAEAEDVVQDAYMRALTGLASFRAQSSLATWLTRIVINEALGRVRRSRPTTEIDEAAADTPDPEAQMATQESRALLESAIDELPDDFRAVFVARMVEGLSVEETASLFNLRPETVKTRVHRAKAKLRSNLEARIGSTAREALAFAGARCDRLMNAVIANLHVLQA